MAANRILTLEEAREIDLAERIHCAITGHKRQGSWVKTTTGTSHWWMAYTCLYCGGPCFEAGDDQQQHALACSRAYLEKVSKEHDLNSIKAYIELQVDP